MFRPEFLVRLRGAVVGRGLGASGAPASAVKMNIIASPVLPSLYALVPELTLSCPTLQESVFGRSKTPAERMRQHQRTLQKAIRELDRERSKLEQQEKKLIQDIKANAKKGQMVRLPELPVFHAVRLTAGLGVRRTPARSWQGILSAHDDTCPSSTRCGPTSRPSACDSRRCEAINRWPKR